MSPTSQRFLGVAFRCASFALAASVPFAAILPGCLSSDTVASSTSSSTSSTTNEDAGASGGDALPAGAISFFRAEACPEDWTQFSEGAGRIPVPTVSGEPNFATQGEPLAISEDRLHSHTILAEASLNGVSYAGVAGEANHGVAAEQPVTIAAPAAKVSSGLPYVQLLMCKKLGEPRAGAAPIPRGMMMFWNGSSCPEGWSRPSATQGRMLVGVPEGAKPGLSFGGTSLSMGEARAHGHAVSGALTTAPHGIALASGCCADSYAADATYPFTTTTSSTDVGLPTIHMLQCLKM